MGSGLQDHHLDKEKTSWTVNDPRHLSMDVLYDAMSYNSCQILRKAMGWGHFGSPSNRYFYPQNKPKEPRNLFEFRVIYKQDYLKRRPGIGRVTLKNIADVMNSLGLKW